MVGSEEKIVCEGEILRDEKKQRGRDRKSEIEREGGQRRERGGREGGVGDI